MTVNADPVAQLATDRKEAHEKNDSWAALCTLGTVNADGDAEQRTLVLRESESRLALFFSSQAPKWQELKRRETCSIQLYLPSIQVQYRLRAAWEKIDPEIVHSSWALRPDIPKRLDWLYEKHPQSSRIDRKQLLDLLSDTTNAPEVAPQAAMGVYLNPLRVERLELSAGVHSRVCWEQSVAGAWTQSDLVP